ncbi:hypothetical protein SLE2022_001730 [Rubroshorea leprosula]
MATPATSVTQNGRSSRLFTEADETRLLKSLAKITKSSPLPTPSSTVDSHTLDRIAKLLGTKFTPSQINDKLRRLRLKYHKHARSRSLIKTPHDQRIFKIAQRIWGKKKNSEAVANNEEEPGNEERGDGQPDLEQFPYLVAEFSRILPENEMWKEGLRRLEEEKLREMNQKWKLLKVEEAKVVAKRAELVQEQVKLVMEKVQTPEELEN